MCPGGSSHLRHRLSHFCCRQSNSSEYSLNTFLLKNSFMFKGIIKPFCMWVQKCSQTAHGLFTSLVFTQSQQTSRDILYIATWRPQGHGPGQPWELPTSFPWTIPLVPFIPDADSIYGFNPFLPALPLGILQSSPSCI